MRIWGTFNKAKFMHGPPVAQESSVCVRLQEAMNMCACGSAWSATNAPMQPLSKVEEEEACRQESLVCCPWLPCMPTKQTLSELASWLGVPSSWARGRTGEHRSAMQCSALQGHLQFLTGRQLSSCLDLRLESWQLGQAGGSYCIQNGAQHACSDSAPGRSAEASTPSLWQARKGRCAHAPGAAHSR